MSNPAALRHCLRDPVPEIEEAARLLDRAVSAHLVGDFALTRQLVLEANMPAIRAWTESLWGAKSGYAPKRPTGSVTRADRSLKRMPLLGVQRELHRRDGYHCRFCGIPVIRTQIRERFTKLYRDVPIWGRKNIEQHAAFQAIWAQYDHVVPHSAGGGNDMENMIVTCAPCNYARMECTLGESGLADPRTREPRQSSWDGLERFR